MSTQYLRKVDLIVSSGNEGILLSGLRIVFRTFSPDESAPPTAYMRIYNLSQPTATRVQKEFEKVTLQAGYENGDTGIIFSGTIIQTKRGAESAIDRYVDIMASDLDLFYNQTVVNKTLAAGSSKKDAVDAIFQKAQDQDATIGHIPDELGTGGTLPRGKVLFGMARDQLSNVTDSAGCTWNIQNGKVNIVPLTGYLPGEAVVLNSQTGLVGIPEATNEGIELKCLLNPKITVGTRIKLDNQQITNTTIRQQGFFPKFGSLNYVANLNDNGVYKVLVVEHSGDTRGNEYYTHLTCLSVDATSSPNNSVARNG